MRPVRRSSARRYCRSPLFWLAILYILVGVIYALVTPMLEKHDEEGHYGYIRYLRDHRRLPPLHSADPWLAESKQPPLYYVVTAVLTGWLPDIEDDGRLLVLNRYMDFSVPGYRNDNRNQYLHPPHLTPVVLGARLISLVFGLGTMLVTYWLASQLRQQSGSQPGGLLPRNALVPLAVAAVVGFQPNFLYVATAVNNDAAIVFLSTVVTAVVVYRLQKGHMNHFPAVVGGLLGLASITKVSGLVLFPLVGLALLCIHRGSLWKTALIRDGIVVLGIALLIGGWWYARNALLYDDPFTIDVHTSDTAETRPLWDRLAHDLAGIEHTFWANPARTFVSEIWLDKVLIWGGRFSLGLLLAGLVFKWRDVRAHLPTFIVLLSWPLTFLFLLVVYWNQRFRWPFGRLLFPAIAPLFIVLVWGWQWPIPARWRRKVTALSAGALVIISFLIPFLSLYPLYHPWRERQTQQIEHPVGTVYVDPETGEQIARLTGYNLLEPYALPGTHFPLELCWKPLGQTDTPYAVFVQLLDLSQLKTHDAPGIWGRRETYPGLGNLPTDRWSLEKTFCDTLMTWVYPDTPTPLGAGIEVGFIEPETKRRLQPVSLQGDPLSLPVIGGLSILAPETSALTAASPQGGATQEATGEAALYVLDDAIGLDQVQIVEEGSIELTLTWRSLRSVPYDATMFIHLKGADGNALAQVDRQPLNGRYPTSYWLPGQIVTDVVSLAPTPDNYDEPLTLYIGLYTWPSLQRLPVKDAEGRPQKDNVILIDVPTALRQSNMP